MIQYKFDTMKDLYYWEVFEAIQEAEKLGVITKDESDDLNYHKGKGMAFINSISS